MKRQRIESGGAGGIPVAEHDSYLDVFDDIASEKVDINAKSKQGCTLLMFAVRFGSLRLMKQVIKTPGFNNVNAQDAEKMTALHHAMDVLDTEGPQKALTLLRDVPGIDVNVKDSGDQTPICSLLYNTFSKSTLDLLDMITKGGLDVNAIVDPSGYTALTWAIEYAGQYPESKQTYLPEIVKKLPFERAKH